MPTRHDRHVSPPRPARKGGRWLTAVGFVAWAGLLSAADPVVPAIVPEATPPTVAPDKVEAVLHTLVQYKWAVLVLLLSLVGIVHIVRKLATESERRKLNILQRCLIGSIILHLLAGFFVTTWIVSNAVKRSVIEVSAESRLVPIDLASLSGESEGGGGEADPRLLQALREQVSNLPPAAAGMSAARATGQSGGGGAPMRNGNVMTGGSTGRAAPSASFAVAESSPTESGRLETASATPLAPEAAQMNASLEARADTSVPRPEMVRPSLDLTAPSRMAVQQVTPEMARPTMNVRVQRPGVTASRMVQVATAEASGATGESASAAPSLSPASASGAMSANTPSTTGVQMESARPVAASASGPTMQNPSSRMDTARGAADAATSARAEMNAANSPARVSTSRSAAGSAVGSFGPVSDNAARSESLGAASAAGSMAATAGENPSGATTSAMQMEAGRLGGGATGAKSGAGMASASSQMDVARAAGSAGASGSASSSRAQMGSGALAGGTAGTARGSSAVGSFGPVSNGNSGGAGEGLSASSSASSLSSSTGSGSVGGRAGGGMQMEAGRLGGGATGAKSGAGLASASSRMDVSPSGNGSGGSATAPGRAAMGNGALAGGRSGAGQGSGSSAVGSFGPVSAGGGSSGGLGAASSAGSLSSLAGSSGAAGGSAGGGMQMEAGRLGGGAAGARSGAGLAGASSRMDVSRSGNGSENGNGGSAAPGRAAMGDGVGTGGKNGAGRGTGSSAVGAFGPATGGGSGGGESLGAAGASRAVAGLPQFAMAGGGFRAEMASPAPGSAGKGSDVGRASSKAAVSRASGSGGGEGGTGSGPARLSGSGSSSGGASKFGSFAAAQKAEFGSGTGESGRGLVAMNFGQQPASLKFGSTDVKLETKPAMVAASPKPAPLPEVRLASPITPMKAAPIVTKVERPMGLIARAPMDLAPLRPVLQPSTKIESVELSRPSELPTSAATRLMDMAVPVRPAVSSLIDTKNPLALRSPEMRAGLLEQLGGNDETEAAVRRALEWFKRTQERDGHWTRGGQGHHSSATALAMLCFMGYGAKHTEPGPYQETLERAMSWLLKQSKAEGDLRGDGDLYDQAIVTMALAEAFNLTKDPRLQEPVRKAVSFIVTAQNKTTGGWRYKPWARDPQEKGDLSVTGWQIMALKSASLAGVEVPSSAFTGAGKFIESLGRGRHGGLYGYRSSDPEPKPTMTAQALFSRLLLGQGTGDVRTTETLAYLREQLPSLREVNYYYWYYGCLALYQHQGAVWEEWNGRMRPIFLKAQRRDGQLSGSWDAEGDRKETYGRFITTALATLSLEVYYRYLPLYKPTLTAASEAQK